MQTVRSVSAHHIHLRVKPISQPTYSPLHSSPCAANLLLKPRQQAAAVPAVQLDYWDVVEYHQQPRDQQPVSPTLRLGLVQQVDADHVQVSPLVEEDEGVWVPDAQDVESPDHQQLVPLERVLRIVESAYGQRQDKEHNPHGEHAHDVWQVLVPLSPDIYKGPGSSSTNPGLNSG